MSDKKTFKYLPIILLILISLTTAMVVAQQEHPTKNLDDNTIFTYHDNKGIKHYVDSIDRVPGTYRDQVEASNNLPMLNKVTGSSRQPGPIKNKLFKKNKKVEIFVTDWCPYCKSLEAFLKNKNIKFTRYNIETHTQGKRLYKKLGGKGGVPLTLIGDQLIQGFAPNKILEALED